MLFSCRYFTPDNMDLRKIRRVVRDVACGGVPKHRNRILLCEATTLADARKELAADGELESKKKLCP